MPIQIHVSFTIPNNPPVQAKYVGTFEHVPRTGDLLRLDEYPTMYFRVQGTSWNLSATAQGVHLTLMASDSVADVINIPAEATYGAAFALAYRDSELTDPAERALEAHRKGQEANIAARSAFKSHIDAHGKGSAPTGKG
jgi:hypothetical protein